MPTLDAIEISRKIAPYAQPQAGRSIWEILITAIPFLLLWVMAFVAFSRGSLLGVLPSILAGGLLLRLFLIQHDCGHGAMFRRRRTNDMVGRAISVLTLTPYDFWRRAHAVHHATSGNLSKRGTGDIDTLTVEEYRKLGRWRRLVYRFYRSPVGMLGVGPSYLFLLRHRLPVGFMRSGWRPWASALGTNAAIGCLAGVMIWQIGLWPFLAVHLPITLIAASAGVWLFYVQHQFERTSWDEDEDWSFHHAAIYGSSHYDLPPVLRWFTANIGIHHLHHLSSRIPFYRLPEAMRAHPELEGVSRITIGESLRTLRLRLWDEEARRLVPLR
ncbi:MAG TPA: fatty acid desaturase [Allosphingosinicella sp.]|uniref:fatty acid desaturase n=1 Tax=Allosphingosinicella sp. TaxID=2823234 RepID=UPI002ED82A29